MAKRAKSDDDQADPGIDVTALEYPRWLHKADGALKRIEDAAACADALADGWTLQPPA